MLNGMTSLGELIKANVINTLLQFVKEVVGPVDGLLLTTGRIILPELFYHTEAVAMNVEPQELFCEETLLQIK